ncbi:MAG TPA: OmpA family protein [Bacteroidales bacterium]|nr:OmpA family protein [Bacteroidales bacterium]
MKRISYFSIMVLLSGFILFSCIPGGKYKTLHDRSVDYMNERDDLKIENLDLSMANIEMEAKLKSVDDQIRAMEEEKSNLEGEIREARSEYNTLNDRYAELQKAQEELIRGNVAETRRLLRELQAAQENLQNKEDLLRQLEMNMEIKKTELDELGNELDKRNARLLELEQILDAQQSTVRDLKQKVSDALFGFEGAGLTVSMKNGKVYVSLDEQLLFKTGSYNIDTKGREALRKLASVLEVNKDIQITIEGHTDDVPYISSGGPIQDNWDLSVKRSTTVVRVLLNGTTIDPKRLTASGRSEYLPVDNRKTTDARQKNRRTEIILTPDLGELYRIIDSY